MNPTISKGELCVLLGLKSAKSGRLYYRTLNTRFMTDETLKEIGITRQQYQKIKIFNVNQTSKIFEIFRIEHELST